MKFETKIPRRKFLKVSAISGACLALGYMTILGEEPKIVNLNLVSGEPGTALNPFIFIDSSGKITLYKGKEIVKRNVPSEIAVEELINLLKENDVWIEQQQLLTN